MEKQKKQVAISERLQALCRMVTPGNVVVDVGCDHGFLPIYLVQENISPRVIAMDVGKGPLCRAKEHIAAYGMEEYIETRLSDGLGAYRAGEAQTLVCAGMGGRLMQKILAQGQDKAGEMTELILQPQSELAEFRRFLRESGYRIREENILLEGGKYYFLMKASPTGAAGTESVQDAEDAPGVRDAAGTKDAAGMKGATGIGGAAGAKGTTEIKDTAGIRDATGIKDAAGIRDAAEIEDAAAMPDDGDTELYDRYGRLLLQNRHPVLGQYLEHSLQTAVQLERQLSETLEKSPSGSGNARVGARLEEIRSETVYLNRALLYFGS